MVFDEVAKQLVGLFFLHVENFLHGFVLRLFQFQFPVYQFLVHFSPFVGIQAVIQLHPELTEFLLVVYIRFLRNKLSLVQDFFKA